MKVAVLNGDSSRVYGSQLDGDSSRVYGSMMNGNSSRVIGSQLQGLENELELLNEVLWGDNEKLNGLFSKWKSRRKRKKSERQARKAERRDRRGARKDARLVNLQEGNRFFDKVGGALKEVAASKRISADNEALFAQAGIDAPYQDIVDNADAGANALSFRGGELVEDEKFNLGEWIKEYWYVPVIVLGTGVFIYFVATSGDGKKKSKKK